MKLKVQVLNNKLHIVIDNNIVSVSTVLVINKRLFYVRELERLYDVYYNNPVLKAEALDIINQLSKGIRVSTVHKLCTDNGIDFSTDFDSLSPAQSQVLKDVYKIAMYHAPNDKQRNHSVLYYFYTYILKYINNELDERSLEVNQLEVK